MPSTICSIENGSVDNHQHISILFYPSYLEPLRIKFWNGPHMWGHSWDLKLSHMTHIPDLGLLLKMSDFFTIENFWEYFLLEEMDLIDVIYAPVYRGSYRGGSDLNILKT